MKTAGYRKRRILILGAGFGGLTFCQSFQCPDTDLILVDQQNHHLFQPLLYQVATAGLSAPDIAQPIRAVLRNRPDVTVLMRKVTGIDLAAREVRLGESVIPYDYLVLALGGVTSYFGHPEWERYAPGLKSLDDALRIRRQILLAFERAENRAETGQDSAANPGAPAMASADSISQSERERLLTIVVVGGGPTGVELAGAFAELSRHVLKRDFRRIDPRQARVILIEAGPRLLPQFSTRLSAKAEAQLKHLGIEVRANARVDDIREGVLCLGGGERIESANIIWAAGVAANPLTRELGVELDRAGRIRVNRDLSVPGHPEVFAIGDIALVQDENGRQTPGVSPAAMQMARHIARLISQEWRSGKTGASDRPAFTYWNKGTMATIGRSAAVAQIGPLEFSGWFAWIAWLLVHLLFLIGFRNKAAVLLQWTYSYFTYKLGSRVIFGLENSNSNPPGHKTPLAQPAETKPIADAPPSK